MKIVKGLYTSANVMVDDIDEATENQIIAICSQPAFKDAKIRIMADTHAGKGVPIGFTAICDKNCVIPNLVGVDIGCSVSAYNVGKSKIDFNKLDDVIRKNIPSGNSVRTVPYAKLLQSYNKAAIDNITMVAKDIGHSDRADYYINSIGTLGSGNHFLSVEVDEEGNHWLLVHTGSRNFGYAICEYHQNKAAKLCSDKNSENYNNIIQSIEPALRQQYILTHPKSTIDTEYAYLSGEDAELYLNHMHVAQSFARLNHVTIIDTICNHMKFDEENKCDIIFTMHNYIEQLNDGSIVIRKGAVSAKSGQQLLIPLNMADGTLVCTGKGNEDWNCSAPHGAGRLMSRNAAKETLSMDDFENSMKHVWSTCIKQSTIDEAPMAYKNADFIKSNIGDVVTIDHHLKPIYNFKAN